jgi:hypothetical protein
MMMQRRAEAGATWQSKAIFQDKIGNPITRPRRTQTAVYAGAQVKGSANMGLEGLVSKHRDYPY